MSLVLDDYVCKHCPDAVVEERLVKRKERDTQVCKTCGKPLERCVSAIKAKHPSWSSWQSPL